ncbi:hypothetical protein ACFYXF_33105 [Streptomyces sp. NPDC002680]|uniref:hypothetical protein n=1 Tax=Streptomyces sp. NPDC002680 TaxID=3364659 RepID=UPI00369F1ED8
MDEGIAAVVAASIGVPGALVGAFLGYRAGLAQAKATLKGVELQLAGERDFALWTGKRDAYSTFLAAVEDVSIALDRARSLAGLYLEAGIGAGRAATAAGQELRQKHKDLLFRQSALRLSVDGSRADDAEALVKIASAGVQDFEDWTDALNPHRGDDDAAFTRLRENTRRLKEGIVDWAANARSDLVAGGTPPQR